MDNETITLKDDFDRNNMTENSYEIVSRIAFLIGVEEERFENGSGLQRSVFYELNKNKDASTIRNLCILRTELLKNFQSIDYSIRFCMGNIKSLKYFPKDVIDDLEKTIYPVELQNVTAFWYLQYFSNLISQNILSCIHQIFPLWINDSFLKDLFQLKVKQETQAFTIAAQFKANSSKYPYGKYLNFPSDEGNILFNDEKFVDLLYKRHNQEFLDRSKLKNLGAVAKKNLNLFLERSKVVDIVVDCENADVCLLYAMLLKLDEITPECDAFAKIRRIVLIDDINTSQSWKLLQRFSFEKDTPSKLSIVHKLAERVKDDKSLVDIRLTSDVCRSHYVEGVDSFILVSSDSDFFGLINSLPEAAFYVFAEKERTSLNTVNAMEEHGIPYCFIDQICSVAAEKFKKDAFFLDLRAYLRENSEINLKNAFYESAANSKLKFTEEELASYFEKYKEKLNIVYEDGYVYLSV